MTYNLAWLNDPTAIRCLLVEAVANVSGTETNFYLSSKGYVTGAADAPANTVYLPGVAGGINVSEEITLDGSASMAYGDVEFYNVAGERDNWLDYVWSNRSIKVYLGDIHWPRADFQLIFDGVISDVDSKSRDRINLKIRDKLERLNSPVSDVKLGGAIANADNLIPLTFGEVFNVTPLLSNPATLEYQVHNGKIERIIEVRDNGVPITSYTNALATGKFTLTSAPAGVITASVQGFKYANFEETYNNTVEKIIEDIVLNYGKAATRFYLADLDTDNLYNFNGVNQQPVGVYINGRENVITVIQQLAASIGAVAVMSRLGKLQLLKITFPPTGTPTAITNTDIVEDSLRLVTRVDVTSSVKLGYCKNWTVQNGLQTGIPEDHKDLLSQEFITITRTNNVVSALYKLDAEPIQRDTLLLSTADANAEADRHMEIFKTPRTVFGFEMLSNGLFLKLGDAVTLTHARFGLSAGKTGTVIKLQPDWMTSRVYVEVILETTPPILDTEVPSVPGTLTATASGQTTIDLAWGAATDNVAVSGYQIYQSSTLIDVIDAALLTYQVTSLTPGTNYSFFIKAEDQAGNIGAASNSANATTSAATDTTAPSAPTGLTATAVSPTAIDLAWTAATDNVGVTGYQIIRNSVLVSVIGNVTSHQDTGLTASTTYTYQVKAVDAADNVSAASNTDSDTTPAATTSTTFSNASSISIPAGPGAATPYPSTITVSGMTGNVTEIVATLNNMSHTFDKDVEIVLQAPDSSKFVMLMGDCGAGAAFSGVTLTFDMDASGPLTGAAIVTGTYLPTNIATGAADTNLPAPAPVMPYGLDLAVFDGMNPNGDWKLYVYDDNTSDAGSIAGGWSLTVTTSAGGSPPSASGITSLVITIATASNLNLTAKGTIDWWKYGLAASAFDTSAKDIGARVINGAYTLAPGYDSEAASPHTFQWSDGKPLGSASASARGLKCQPTISSGWEITVKATPTARTFTLYLTTFSCTSQITVSISDGSSASFSDVIAAANNAAVSANYAITFGSATPGAIITIRYEILSIPGATAPYLQIAASTLE